MKKIAVLGLLALAVALALTLTGVSTRDDTASAQVITAGPVTIDCVQTQTPSQANGWEGVLTCDLTVQLPDPPGGTVSFTLEITYEDVDQSGSPSFGDRLLCWTLQDSNGNVIANRCIP